MKCVSGTERRERRKMSEEIITQNEVVTDVDDLWEIVHYLENIGDMRGGE